MNDNRRDFLRKATLGSVLTSLGGITLLQASPVSEKDDRGTGGCEIAFPGWDVHFDEASSFLSLINGPVSVSGKLAFVSGAEKWTIAASRDGITNRYALVDLQGNVQGYLVFNPQADQVQVLFYHRTAQAYTGILSFEGEIAFLPGGFACKTRPEKGERVLSLGTGNADSLLNDSLFAPESDTVLQMDASMLKIETFNAGAYTFAMSGAIGESAEAAFTVTLENGYFRSRYVPYYHPVDRKRCPKAPTGWMSWNTYFDQATAEDNLAEARIGKKYLQPFGCEFWSIESWQGNSPHLPVRDFYNMDLEVDKNKFPEGMKQLADDIRKLGFRPGLWTAPFGTGNKEFYEAHRNWFLHDESGRPVSSWNGRYTLDPTVPEAREHLKKIHRIASREWGYEFFKIDGMSGRSHGYCAHLYERPEIRSRFHDPSCPNPFELCVKAFREGIGEDRVFLACQGHTSGPEPRYADASRIGADIVHPNEPVKWANVFNQGRCTINQVFTHNIVLINDPDTLLVRDLSLEEARVSATVVALPGQLTFFGDKLAGLPDQRMKMLQQSLPVADVRPMSLYPHFAMLPVWNLAVRNEFLGSYNVVALFNWEDEPKQLSFTVGELGIDPDREYVLYEFWTGKSAGIVKESFTMELLPHSVRLFGIHRLKTVPQWIGSDRHIAQNALELDAYRWNDPARSLEGSVRLIASFPLTARFHVPEGYSFGNVSCEGAACSAVKEPGNVLAVTFRSAKTAVFPFRLGF